MDTGGNAWYPDRIWFYACNSFSNGTLTLNHVPSFVDAALSNVFKGVYSLRPLDTVPYTPGLCDGLYRVSGNHSVFYLLWHNVYRPKGRTRTWSRRSDDILREIFVGNNDHRLYHPSAPSAGCIHVVL